jgi:hypothetical protein
MSRIRAPRLDRGTRLDPAREDPPSAAAGEEVIIASNGKPVATLVPVEERRGLRGWGKLKIDKAQLDAAFSAEVEEEIARLFESQ